MKHFDTTTYDDAYFRAKMFLYITSSSLVSWKCLSMDSEKKNGINF